MIDIVANKQAEIEALCETYGVQKLWLFGSATTGAWSPAASDLDFLVDLGIYERGVSDRYLGLLVTLEQLLGTEVDLLTSRQVKSEWFRKEIMATREIVYDASRQSVVA